jgi:FkbM family methyltransferase
VLAELRRPWIQERGIRGVIDIGANEGQFAALARETFPSASLLCFEPLPDCYERLCMRFATDQRFAALPIALGATSGDREIYRSDFSPSSSLLQMADAHREAFPYTAATRATRVKCGRLDDVPEAKAVPEPLFLKIDVQGYEREVILGGPRVLARASLVLVELSLVELYASEPLFEEMLPILSGLGLRFAGIAGMLRHPRSARLLQLDAMFERTTKG